jgi:C-terminal processing protease CtpA/Prc
MDHPTVEIMSKYFGPIEGIVGFPFFARYKTTIDYQAKTLTFVPTGYQPPDTLKAMVATVMALAGDQPAKKVLAPAGSWGMILRKPASDEDAGVLVDEVMPGTPAAVAGLRTGDRLLSVDGRWTDTVADAYRAAGYVKPGTRATLVIKRGEQEIKFNVTPQAGI